MVIVALPWHLVGITWETIEYCCPRMNLAGTDEERARWRYWTTQSGFGGTPVTCPRENRVPERGTRRPYAIALPRRGRSKLHAK
jgi:hypothetical protein